MFFFFAFLFPLFPFFPAFLAFFFLFLLADAAQFDPVERDFQGRFAAGAADAVLEAAGFFDSAGEQGVEVVADRKKLGIFARLLSSFGSLLMS